MLRASALYIVIVIALVIAVLCSSLIVSAYYYRLQYQKKFRYDQLQINLNSGVNILLVSDSVAYKSEKTFGLYGAEEDSVSLRKSNWGIFEVATSKAFIQRDTLQKTFMIANTIDSTKWAALYLIDEDRPLSVSGNTMIRGNAFVPKAGVKEAYVDGKAYQGDKRLVIGNKHDSQRELPGLQESVLKQLKAVKGYRSTDSSFHNEDSISNSFFNPVMVVNFRKRMTTISNIKLSGNMIILSDTNLIIDKTANLNNVIVYARSISVQAGFQGKCQLFAQDSIGIQRDCVFNYPSCLGILRFTADKGIQGRINIGENTQINGAVFTYEKEKSQLQNLIDLAKNVKVFGQVYSQGLVRFKSGGEINGSVFTNRFLYQSTYTTFENYLINTRIDANGLSPYYLTGSLFPVAQKKQKVLQWLEIN
jgi:hypothetical protein